MKKIVLGLSLIVTVVTQAATCSWGLNNILQDPDNVAKSSYTAYLIDANKTSVENMTALLSKGDFSALASVENSSSVSFLLGGRVNATGFGSYEVNTPYTFYTIILNAKDTKDATYFYTSKELTTNATDMAPLGMAFGDLTTGTYAGSWTLMAVPEPTSGLLLLIGGALLALRRKQR